ncbi:PLDc N-terminal domain-containing protein [Pontibacter sp. HSC-14F20]|uniref:PLDc N-terminal domain-containing protein n=1 Tax=Pontibacter sp. HSC-14F20 TaxID=2864136 RepID=UPI001C7392FE|nr:PLDc N-terminal domain-containing protein [Pontibacter sp. HSC-14F20]MBX0333877.1 PLDc N-terminal domain-containing protein [Pontibacter sp. HSC-14F20]
MLFCFIGNDPFFGSIALVVVAYYILVVLSLLHLIFRTNYSLTERLLWMVVLWVVPVFGLLAYWVFWKRRASL